MRKVAVLIIFFLLFQFIYGQGNDSIVKINHTYKQYSFIIQDAPASLFTMQLVNTDYISAYRYSASVLNESFKPIYSYSIQATVCLLAFTAITHEEGHRSVLVAKNIGSVSEPFTFARYDGFVSGVTDSTLENLRGTDFPDFIRLYTAGFESDYMMAKQEESILAFGDEESKNIMVEYLIRKSMLIQYFLIGFFKYDIDGHEETNERDRDIVGNDFYGAIRQLHRPNMLFQRYTRFAELTPVEIAYMKKVGARTLFNLVNLNIIGIRNFRVSDKLSLNFGMGHCLGPFGDYIDEWLWLNYNKKIKLSAYFREYENENYWFPAAGISLNEFDIGKRFQTTVWAHYWDQPRNLSFTEKSGNLGVAVDITCRYKFFTLQKTTLKQMSLDIGIVVKSNGFLPENMYLTSHFGFRLGTSLYFK
jgi:hypothetical protein